MNIFNRIIMVIMMLFLIVSSIVAGVNIFANLFNWQDIADRVTEFFQMTNPYILALVLFAILVISLIVLIFEFYRRKIKVANISTDQSGKSMIALKTISTQVRENLAGLEDVVDPRVKIIPKHNGIVINSFSKLRKGVDITDKTKEIRDTADDFASKNLGFKVIKSNYTATGFVTKNEMKVKEIKKEESEIKDEPEVQEEE